MTKSRGPRKENVPKLYSRYLKTIFKFSGNNDHMQWNVKTVWSKLNISKPALFAWTRGTTEVTVPTTQTKRKQLKWANTLICMFLMSNGLTWARPIASRGSDHAPSDYAIRCIIVCINGTATHRHRPPMQSVRCDKISNRYRCARGHVRRNRSQLFSRLRPRNDDVVGWCNATFDLEQSLDSVICIQCRRRSDLTVIRAKNLRIQCAVHSTIPLVSSTCNKQYF